MNAQNVIGRFYTVQDPRNPQNPDMKIRYRLDSIVGDARTGYLTLYQSIGGNSTDWNYDKHYLGHFVRYYIKSPGNSEIDDKSFYVQYPKEGYRTLMLREVGKTVNNALQVDKIEISFGEDIKSLSYRSVPIIWREHATAKAVRPAEYYLNGRKENMTGGTEVNPYAGRMVKMLSDDVMPTYDPSSRQKDIDINRTINLELKGVVGNSATGLICPIFSIMTTHDDDDLPNILRVTLYDEDGNKRVMDGKAYLSPQGVWTEAGDLTTTIDPNSATLQKMTVIVGNSWQSSSMRVFEFKDVPIQWIEVK